MRTLLVRQLLQHPHSTYHPATRILSVMAFHEKAGRSQVDSLLASLNKVFFLPPSGHCRHASIRTLEERRGRKIAKVAMARKLAVHLYWMWRQGWTTASCTSSVRTRESPEIAMVCSKSPT